MEAAETIALLPDGLGLRYQRGDGTIHCRLVIAHGSFLKERVTSFVSGPAALKETVDYLTTSPIGAKVPIHQVP